MKNMALGIFETFGFVPAVAGTDAALKSAAVELLGFRYIGSGLVSVLLLGDVSSAKVAVDAAVSAAEQVGSVKWCTVIARTADGLEVIIADAKQSLNRVPKKAAVQKKPRKTASPEEYFTPQRLFRMHVKELRGIARQLDGLTLDRSQIRSARKDELVDAIISYYSDLKE